MNTKHARRFPQQSQPQKGVASTSRRRFLQSALLAGGVGLTPADILRLRSEAAEQGNSTDDTAVIQIWLGGGHSQFETFDPKPLAPTEVRGPYRPISTKLPGIQFCEMLPKLAGIADQTAIIRSVTHSTNGHFIGAHWCATGYQGTNNRASHPSTGAIASRFCQPNNSGLPPYVLLSQEQTRNLNIGEIMGPAYLGVRHNPFTVMQDSFVDQFEPHKIRQATANLKLADDITLDRIDDRKSLLGGFDRFARNADASRTMDGIDHFNALAFDMLTSGEAKRAFDLNRESPATRQRYGMHRWGQMGLLARRLVEAGTTFVTLNTAPDSLCWDWHLNIQHDHRPADGSEGPSRGMEVSGPPLDQMLTALITDLYERGLDKRVLLVVWGEFGRTPRINKTGGRDHWGSLMSILLAGGGLRMGQVIGASSRKGEEPISRPVGPTDVLATMYRHLGIDIAQNTVNAAGRPIPLLPDGNVISELLA